MNHDPRQSIVVTGAGGGIGQAIVRTLLRRRGEGHASALVIALDREWSTVESDDPTIATALEAGALIRRELDVADEGAVCEAFTEIGDHGLLRAVVHAAGILCTGPATDTPVDATRNVFNVNALGTIWVGQHAARIMTSQNASHLGVNVRSITTIASNAGNGPRAGFSVYGASKAAASSFTRSLGLELGPHGIRCNVVSPGTTLTPMVTDMWRGEDRSSIMIAGEAQAYRTGIPLGRVADPQDVADVVDFLVSERARHITLADLTVDGGATQR
jgi:2,3-dihydro-2,3-dihydroxybenzoate dehydrogenase